MTDQQTHLKQVLEQQKGLIEEINALNSQITSKREMAVKLQGVAEYLDQIGVKLPKEDETPETTPEVVDEAPAKEE